MEEETSMNPKPKKDRVVKTAWIFDVDGVITNPSEKKVTEPEILDEIIKRLENEEPVTLNTGRSLVWVKDRVLNPLVKIVKDKNILKYLLAIGEKGGTWAEFDKQGNLIENKDNDISIPDNLKNEIRSLIKNKYSDCMFYDESKLTMISTEMKDGYSLEDFKEKQKELSSEFNTLFTKNNLGEKFKIDPTTIATDIESIYVGKHFAIRRILKWTKGKGIKPQKYIAFGDSFSSDIPMAEELHKHRLSVKFMYVGKEDIQIKDYPFPIKQSQSKFEKGTLEFLKSL